jgi:Leucine-rich repeat (LRR) protein
VAKPSSRRARWFFVLIALGAIAAAGIAFTKRASRANAQREAVARIEALGGSIDERIGSGPEWLVRALGEDFFTSVSKVTFASDSQASKALVHVARLDRLESLDLSGALIGDDDLAHLKDLASLQALFLRNTNVGDKGLKSLPGLANLRRLDLSGTKVTDKGLGALSRFKQLERLWLEETKATGAWMKSASLANLEHLSLAESKTSGEHLEHLARFPKLATLRLDGTQIGDADLAHLEGLTHLDNALYLSGCPITDEGLVHLATLTRLKSLDLRGTDISPEGGARIGQSLPFCEVAYDGK